MFPEPKVSFLVLDYKKPNESRLLLESIKKHVKFPYKVIYLHNGYSQHAQMFMQEGLIDQLIMTAENDGLGLGTRNLFAACFSPYTIYAQNDQILGRDFTEEELDYLINHLDMHTMDEKLVKSVSLAGAPCGDGIYSERAHLIETLTYREWENTYPMPHGGAGPFHDIQWREGYIQSLYKKYGWTHYIYQNPMFVDNGVFALRENPDGSIWCHRTDNKKLWNIIKPKEKYSSYPKFTDKEWDDVLTNGWPDGKIPENEIQNSFSCWDNTALGIREFEYIRDLRIKHAIL